MSRPAWMTRQRLQVLAYIGLAIIAIVVTAQIQASITERTITRRIQPQIDRIERTIVRPQTTKIVPGGNDSGRPTVQVKKGQRVRVKPGATGSQGVAGNDGGVGPRGVRGPRGRQGIRGLPGAQGPRGPAGLPGQDAATQALESQVQALQSTVNALSGTIGQLRGLICDLSPTC